MTILPNSQNWPYTNHLSTAVWGGGGRKEAKSLSPTTLDEGRLESGCLGGKSLSYKSWIVFRSFSNGRILLTKKDVSISNGFQYDTATFFLPRNLNGQLSTVFALGFPESKLDHITNLLLLWDLITIHDLDSSVPNFRLHNLMLILVVYIICICRTPCI